MRICITGGAGFIGLHLCQALQRAGHIVTSIDRAPSPKRVPGVSFVQANLMQGQVPQELKECDAIIHLAGASIFGRWTKEYKKEIIQSRIQTAETIYKALEHVKERPKVFISASAIGFYGDRGEELLSETSSAGEGFLPSVCIEWERVAQKFEHLNMRSVSIRTAVVLGPGGGMMAKVLPIFRWGLGGKMGSGKQWFSWIHIEDLVRVYQEALSNSALSGPINASSPHPLRNVDFAKALGKELHRPSFFPAPAFAMEMILGEFASAILSSQKVSPQKLINIHFPFQYPTIEIALHEI